MKNEKAFTLVELLGILVILGLILIVTFPSMITIFKRSADNEYKRFVKDLELAAETYVDQNTDELNLTEPGDTEFIELDKLVAAGYLNKKLINPKTEKEVELNTTVLVTLLNDNTKRYEYTGTVAGIHNYNMGNLVVMYDGYNKLIERSGKLIWTDIMGNADGELINALSIDAWYDNKIKLGQTNNYINVPNSSSLIPANSEATIEIVYEVFDESAATPMRNSGLGLYYLDLYNDGLIRSMVRNSTDTANLWPATTSLPMATPNRVHTLTISITKNGSTFDFNYFGDAKVLPTSSSNGLKLNNLDFNIGKDYTTDNSSVYIHGFRLYNTALAKDEIIMNHQIDINRYNWRKK